MRRAVLLWLLLGAAAPSSAPMDPHLFVVTSDSSGGSADVLETIPPWTVTQNVEAVEADAMVRHYYGLHYVVNPSRGTIQVIDPATFETILTRSVGAASRPHDILVVEPNRAYVSRYDDALLWEIDPKTGRLRDVIDLGPLADADGVPEMSMMALDGNHLFVQIQRLDRDNGLLPVSPSCLAVIDITTNEVLDIDGVTPGIQGIVLQGTIPSFRMHVDHVHRRLFVSAPGPRLNVSGGIEEIDLDTLASRGFILSEAAAGVDLGGFVMVGPDRGYVIAHTDIVASSHLTAFHRDPNAPGQGEFHTSLWTHNDHLAYDPAGNYLFYPEAAASPPGIHVFDTLTNTRLTQTPVPTGKTPTDLVVARAVTPGEAGNLVVTGYEAASGHISFTYGQACGATNHNIVFGPLEDVQGYGYSGQVCGIGASGSYATFDPGSGSYFFLVVGTDGGGHEGSYGRASSGAERPEDRGDPVCRFHQDLTARCDS